MRRALVLGALLVTSLAHAQPAVESKARIKEGKALLKKKQIAEACAKFAEAETLVPAASTTMLLADCREKEDKLATAYALFGKAAESSTSAKDKRGAAEAKRRAKKLEARLLYVTISVPAERRVFQLELAIDGVAIAEDTWGTKQPFDPGTYTITAKAPGRVTWTTSITVDKAIGNEQVVEMAALDEVPKPPPPPPPKPVAKAHGRRFKGATIGLTVIGVGGMGLGVAFGLRAKSLASDADAICPHDACLDAGALDLNQRARSSATYANVAFIGGGVALAGAAVLWWIGRPTVRPVVEREQVGLVVEGAW